MRQPGWLDRESESWQRDGVITPDQRRAILARYSGRAERNVADTLMWLAALAGGVGLVLLVGWNWDQLPRSAQLGLAFGGTAVLFGAALAASASGRRALAGRLTFLASVVAASMFVAVDDVYHVAQPGVSVFWALTACLAAALMPGTAMILLAAGVTTAWIIVQGGGGAPPWPFLAMVPLLALAVEQAPDRFGAGAVTGAIVLWAWSVGNETWSNAFATSLVFSVIGAAALDAWAQAPASRRPAFARATPAAFFAFIALLLLQLGHQNVVQHAFADATASLWLALAIAMVLALVAVSSILSRPAAWRPAGLAALGLVWLGTFVAHPASVSGSGAQLPWNAAFGLAAVLTGVSLVRQAARDQDLGLFVMGVLNVIGFVAVRAIEANGNLWQSALALFAGAVILWWLGRTWASRREAAR